MKDYIQCGITSACIMYPLIVQKRKVEYKDPQETAWEDFQKTISKSTEVLNRSYNLGY